MKIYNGTELLKILCEMYGPTGFEYKVAEFIKEQTEKVMKAVKGVEIKTIAVENEFFGHTVNCTGLLTGKDIIDKVNKDGEGYEYIVMPCHVLKENTDLFLDGITVSDVEKQTGKKVRITNGSGESFVKALSLDKYGV